MIGITQPALYLSHGGRPWPWMKKELPIFDGLELGLRQIQRELPEKPNAILMVSGHWEEEDGFAVTANPHPPMLYDYGGFPEYTYHIQYPAPGDPELAREIQHLLASAGLKARLDNKRGFDHGMYSVLYPMYPDADIPVVQLSIKSDFDPQLHLEAGWALSSLRQKGVLIVGSGSSYHNMRMPKDSLPTSRTFDNWLQETLVYSSPGKRTDSLIHWTTAPLARVA